MSAARTTLAVALACTVGLAVAHATTDGFQAFTLESARRLQALRSPSAVPELQLEFSDGRRAGFAETPARTVLVDFIYTRCPTVCAALGSVYARLQDKLAAEIAAGEIELVSISLDPAHDGPQELFAYRARFSNAAAGWHVARPAPAGELPRWLDAFGVVVIPDGMGGFVHNAAVHIVGPERKLAAILDYQDIDAIAGKAREIARGTGVALR
ncbi:MAG: SCO family protein [Betaproteobacteria bacterium]